MRRRAATVLTISGSLGACATLPDLASSSYLPIETLTRHVNCEIQRAFRPIRPEGKKHEWFDYKDWAISVEYTLKSDFDIDLGAGGSVKRGRQATFADKFFNFGFGGNINQKAHRDTSFKYENTLAAIVDTLNCSNATKTVGSHPLLGDLGIESWREQFIGDYDAVTRPNSFTHGFLFNIYLDAQGTPSWKFTHGGGLATLASAREDQNQVSIAMTKIPRGVAATQKERAGPTKPGAPQRPQAVPPGLPENVRRQLEQLQQQRTLQNLDRF